MTKNCLHCNKTFNRKPSEILGRTFCGRSCYQKARSNDARLKHTKECPVCYIIFSKKQRTFCSRKCCFIGKKPSRSMFWLGKKRSLETIAKLSMSMKGRLVGEKHPNWKGGITNPRKIIMRSDEYKFWRISVFQRDNYTCQECGVRSGNGQKVILNADHIKPFSLFHDLRFELTNGRTLCEPCHRKTETFGGRAVALANNTT